MPAGHLPIRAASTAASETVAYAAKARSALRIAFRAGASGAISSRKMSDARTGGFTGAARSGRRFDAGSDDVDIGGGGVGVTAIVRLRSVHTPARVRPRISLPCATGVLGGPVLPFASF